MAIEREGRFRVWRDMPRGPGIGLDSSLLAACIEEARRVPFKGVFGNPFFGFREDTLEALEALPDIEAVWFWDVELRNVDTLYELPKLTYFGVHPKRPAIDFARLPTLERLVWFYKAADRGVASLRRLTSLNSWRYRDKSKTMAALAMPETLTELGIYWANVETLDGLPTLPRLRRLEVHRCRNLRSLGNLGSVCPRLEQLVVDACGRVEDGEGERVARQLPLLEHAYVKDRVNLADR
jgi:hypothetical protein